MLINLKTVVSTNPLAAGLSPVNFKDPLEFKPERWLGTNETDITEATQPFSLGARGCLGRRYVFIHLMTAAVLTKMNSLAWIELRTTLAKMHFKYDIKLLNEELDWHRDSEMHTLWNKPNLMVHVVPRAGP